MAASEPMSGAAGARTLLLGIVLLGLIGIGIAGYLTYVHYNEDALVCTTGGCETVQQSEYSTIGDIPIAIFGLLMFTTVTLLAAARLTSRVSIPFEPATTLAWTLLLTSLLYYAYLTYIEIFDLDAICQWCVASSIIALLLFALESILLFHGLSEDR